MGSQKGRLNEHHGRIQRGTWGSRPPLKITKNIGFLSNSGPDPLKNHKATKPVFNVGLLLARQQNAIEWRFTGGPMMARFLWYLDPHSLHQLKKVGPPLTKLSRSAHEHPKYKVIGKKENTGLCQKSPDLDLCLFIIDLCLFIIDYVCSLLTYVCSLLTNVCSLLTYVCSLLTYVCSLLTYICSLLTYVCSLLTYICSLLTYVC